jgi:hypothetical protein
MLPLPDTNSLTLINMNRADLQDALIQQMLDDMDLKTMTQLCYDYLDDGYSKYSDEELTAECEQYYPELLEGVTDD